MWLYMEALATYLTNLCIRHDLVDESSFDWCVYSIGKRLVTSITRFFLILIGCVLFGIIESSVFVFSLLLLRKFTNGYHASSYLGCLFLSILIEIACLSVAPLLSRSVLALAIVLSDILICAYAPYNDVKIHLTPSEIIAAKLQIRKLLVLLNITCLFLFAVHSYLLNYIAMVLIADSASLLLAKKA